MALSVSLESIDDNATLKAADGSLISCPIDLLPAGAFIGQKLWLDLSLTEPLEAAPAAILNEILKPHDDVEKTT